MPGQVGRQRRSPRKYECSQPSHALARKARRWVNSYPCGVHHCCAFDLTREICEISSCQKTKRKVTLFYYVNASRPHGPRPWASDVRRSASAKIQRNIKYCNQSFNFKSVSINRREGFQPSRLRQPMPLSTNTTAGMPSHQSTRQHRREGFQPSRLR